MAARVNPEPLLQKRVIGATLPGLAIELTELVRSILTELRAHAVRLNGALMKDGTEPMTAPLGLRSYTVATVPPASQFPHLIYVSNESGGAVPAFSDGTNWRRVTDRAVIS